jgi:ABC-type lipoprotein release transport system permease subunit
MFRFLVFSLPWSFCSGDIVFILWLSLAVALLLVSLSVSGTTSDNMTSTMDKLSPNINILYPHCETTTEKLNTKTKNNIQEYLRHST